MTSPVVIRDGVRLVLVTGAPGSGKTELTRKLACCLPEDWRVIHLDDFFVAWACIYGRPGDGNVWPAVDRGADLPGLTAKRYLDEGASVVIEGIIRGDNWAKRLCAAAGLQLPSPAVRVVDLNCSRAVAIARMTRRRIRAPGDTFDPGRHFDYLRPASLVACARCIDTDSLDADAVLTAFVEAVNADP